MKGNFNASELAHIRKTYEKEVCSLTVLIELLKQKGCETVATEAFLKQAKTLLKRVIDIQNQNEAKAKIVETVVDTGKKFVKRKINIDDVEFVGTCNQCDSSIAIDSRKTESWLKKFSIEKNGVGIVDGKYICRDTSVYECESCERKRLEKKLNSEREFVIFGKCQNCDRVIDMTNLTSATTRNEIIRKYGFTEKDGKLICNYTIVVEKCPKCCDC